MIKKKIISNHAATEKMPDLVGGDKRGGWEGAQPRVSGENRLFDKILYQKLHKNGNHWTESRMHP